MGLAMFDERTSSYCSSSTMDRTLTISLIESSECPLRSSSRFAHTPEWADGLDVWSLSSTMKTDSSSRRLMDFQRELGLYLPRHEKPSSAPISLKTIPFNSKLPTNHFTPERLRLLFRKEKDLLETSLPPPPPPPPPPMNTHRQCAFFILSSF